MSFLPIILDNSLLAEDICFFDDASSLAVVMDEHVVLPDRSDVLILAGIELES